MPEKPWELIGWEEMICLKQYRQLIQNIFWRLGMPQGSKVYNSPSFYQASMPVEFMELLMGWPILSTALSPLETDRFPKWRQQHSEFLVKD
jgi:hypothetical protein